jgi:DNA polymerase-1
MKRLVLIDGHAILHRAYHAFPKNLTTRKGELVNAVYGFTRMLLKVIEDLKPDYLAVAFDLPKPTFRHKEFIGYQVQRPKMDAELKDQIERVFQVVGALNMPMFTLEGYEADDIIGTLAKQAAKKRLETVIVTGDKDIMQLVKKRVKVYAPVKGFSQAKLFDPKEVEEDLGVRPEQIIDYKALVGDPSDNYPGVPGVGPKTAVDLLSNYQTLDRIYKNIKKIRPVVAKKLEEGEESAELSRRLAEIVTDAPVKLNLKACRVHDYDQVKAQQLFEELEFKSLVEKLPGVTSAERKAKSEEKKEKNKNKQMKLL